jgi:hypothetical protein
MYLARGAESDRDRTKIMSNGVYPVAVGLFVYNGRLHCATTVADETRSRSVRCSHNPVLVLYVSRDQLVDV